MINPCTYQESLHRLNNGEWNTLSLQDRAAVMQSIENEVARRTGMGYAQRDVDLFTEMPINNRVSVGGYNTNDKKIWINTYHLANDEPIDCLNTILHEGRHAYQHQAVKGEVSHHNIAEVKAWQNNMKPGHYIDGRQNIKAYYRQPIEADAREYADITTSQILGEQKIQNRYNKGIGSFVSKSQSPQHTAAPINKGIVTVRQKAMQRLAATSTQTIPSANKGIVSYRSKAGGQSGNNPGSGSNGGVKTGSANNGGKTGGGLNGVPANGSGQRR